MDNIELVFNETTQKWEERKEPFITVEIETEEDYEFLKTAVEYYGNRDKHVEVVHGRWIEKHEPITWCEDDEEVFYECSVCKCQNFGESPYCPNCGAKMDLE